MKEYNNIATYDSNLYTFEDVETCILWSHFTDFYGEEALADTKGIETELILWMYKENLIGREITEELRTLYRLST